VYQFLFILQQFSRSYNKKFQGSGVLKHSVDCRIIFNEKTLSALKMRGLLSQKHTAQECKIVLAVAS